MVVVGDGGWMTVQGISGLIVGGQTATAAYPIVIDRRPSILHFNNIVKLILIINNKVR